MFLRFLWKHNPALIDYGVFLLEHGLIEPDTYVLDLDGLEENARRLQDLAIQNRLYLYFMSKQLGRNPEVSRRVLAAAKNAGFGFTGMVAVDFREAQVLHNAGLPVKHLGHLCQIPHGSTDAALDMKPEVITVYTLEKAAELSEAAQKRSMVQNILLRVYDEGDIFYQGQEGGFLFNELYQALDSIKKLPGVQIVGLTSFPCFLFQEDQGRSLPTPNAHTLVKGAALLAEHGIRPSMLNMPSCNSPATIALAATLGATHLEPGHSLTGTNPDNLCEQHPLKPSLLYMSEVSHHHQGHSFCYGGGYYRRSKLQYALVKIPGGFQECEVLTPSPETIDYYLQLSGLFPQGSPVCMSFRTQIFVTRSRIALVEGLAQSRPVLHSVWDSLGNCVSRGDKP
jgi:predicted amino acid racemase